MKNEMMIKDLKARRNDRFLAFMESLKDFIEMSKIYKSKDAQKILSNVIKKIKNVTEKNVQLFSLKIENNVDNFIDEIISSVREAGEYIVELELKEINKDLIDSYIEDTIDYIEVSAQSKYLNAVKLLVQLAKVKRVNNLNNNVFEMEKDLKACISYNEKIKNMADSIVANEELSDDFVENTLKECVGV